MRATDMFPHTLMPRNVMKLLRWNWEGWPAAPQHGGCTLPALATVDTAAHSRALRVNQRHIQSSDQGLCDWMITCRKGQQRHRKRDREKLMAREALGGVWLYWEYKSSFPFLSLTVTYGGHESSGVAARASTHWAISSGWQLPLSSGKTPKAAKVQTPRFLLSAHTLSTTTKVMG